MAKRRLKREVMVGDKEINVHVEQIISWCHSLVSVYYLSNSSLNIMHSLKYNTITIREM